MAQAQNGSSRSFKAGADLLQFTIVKLDTTTQNQVLPATSGADEIAGVVSKFSKDGSEGDTVHVDSQGFSTKLLMGEACNIGDPITAGALGKGAVAASGELAIGRALEAAVLDGDLIEVSFLPQTVA